MATPSERFTAHAGAYTAGRPDYPAEALAMLLDGAAREHEPVVADLGAGTGISARALTRAGARVFAVEPNAAMRAGAEPDARITWIDGSAEATTLPAASVDVAVALQAWHWFASAAAWAESRRIVRTGGRIAVAYYERDERDPDTAAYGAIVRRFAVDDTEARRAAALAEFRERPQAVCGEFSSAHVLDREAFDARLRSTSYLPRSGEPAAHLREAADGFFLAHERAGTVTLCLTISVAYVRV